MRIPKSWSEISIGQFQELAQIQSEDQIATIAERVAVLTDTDPDYVRNLPLKQFYDISNDLDFVKEKIPTDWKPTFEWNGQKYGFIPDLTFVSTGEWLDAEAFKQDVTGNLHNYAALLWRPIVSEEGEEYQIKEHTTAGFSTRAKLFKELPITYIQGGLVFFLTFSAQCLETMKVSLAKEMQKTQTQKKKPRQKAMKKPRKESSLKGGRSIT
jgi:hypothetical protein